MQALLSVPEHKNPINRFLIWGLPSGHSRRAEAKTLTIALAIVDIADVARHRRIHHAAEAAGDLRVATVYSLGIAGLSHMSDGIDEIVVVPGAFLDAMADGN
ncbi:hypothetical protein NKI50_22925, partial [Mesorhizobium sp. M0563]